MPHEPRRPEGHHRPRERNSPADRSSAADRGGPRAPVIDAEVTGKELDRQVRQELATLAGPVAGTVARHLVMAGRLLDDDPGLAHQHAQQARRMAGRVAVVREAAGLAAYQAGHFDVALSELRTARRISGRADYLPLMADCERGVGRPEKALELADDPAAAALDRAGRAELAIVAAGALRDLDRPDEARLRLEGALTGQVPPDQPTARLQYALGDLLSELGHRDEAVSAFAAAEAADVDGDLDAGERVVELLQP